MDMPPQNVLQTKQEMREENGDESCSDIEALFSDEEYDSEDDYDHHLMKKYCQQVKESQGFDVEDYPGQCWMTTAFPMPNYLNNPENVFKLKGYAGKALKEYNDREGTSYEVDDILMVNGGIWYSRLSWPVPNDDRLPHAKLLSNLENVKKLKDYAGKVLKKYNDREGTSYEVDDILKVNGGGCRNFIYYTVKDGDQCIFQAPVEVDFDYHLEIPIVRPKKDTVVE